VVDGLEAFFALGLAVLAFGLAVGAFLAAGAFLVVAVLLGVFLGAAFLAAGAGTAAGLGLASFDSFCMVSARMRRLTEYLLAITFGAATLVAGASFFASLTGPDGPERMWVSYEHKIRMGATRSRRRGVRVVVDVSLFGGHTFGLCEFTLLNTSLDRLVEHDIE
jgi:hypothetical protein